MACVRAGAACGLRYLKAQLATPVCKHTHEGCASQHLAGRSPIQSPNRGRQFHKSTTKRLVSQSVGQRISSCSGKPGTNTLPTPALHTSLLLLTQTLQRMSGSSLCDQGARHKWRLQAHDTMNIACACADAPHNTLVHTHTHTAKKPAKHNNTQVHPSACQPQHSASPGSNSDRHDSSDTE